MRSHSIVFLLLAGLFASPVHPAAGEVPDNAPAAIAQLIRDPGFEESTPGRTPADVWEIQRTGRPEIKNRLIAICASGTGLARSGRQCLSLSIPQDTAGFEFVTAGQRLRLDAGREYEASLWVRWPAGPDIPPAGAEPGAARPSAIVSFWVRHRDGKGAFAGRDEWLFVNRWRKLSFRFRATDPAQLSLVYVSLLPNQSPAPTTVLVDDFELLEIPGPAEPETRGGGIVADGDFAGQRSALIAPPWTLSRTGGTRIAATVKEDGSNRFVSLAMGENISNFESTQLSQRIQLREGVRYEISCRMRWDNFAPSARAPIVNYGIFHEPSRTWYGPVDQILEKTGDWRTYRFIHIPPHPGAWKLYTQLNGWGNFGSSVAVSIDDFTCAPAP